MQELDNHFPQVEGIHRPLPEVNFGNWKPIWDYRSIHKGPGGIAIKSGGRLYRWTYTGSYFWNYQETYTFTWWLTNQKGKLHPARQPALWDHIHWLYFEFKYEQWDLECRRWKYIDKEATKQGHIWETVDWESTLRLREGYLHEQETNRGDYLDNSN